MSDAAVDEDLDVVDFSRGLTAAQTEKIFPVDTVPSELIKDAWDTFKRSEQHTHEEATDPLDMPTPCTIYEHKDFPGWLGLRDSIEDLSKCS